MKKIYFLALTAVACAFLSCQKAEAPVESGIPEVEAPQPEGAFQARLYFNFGQDGTRAFGTGATEPWEKVINTVTVFVFNQSEVLIYRRDLTAEEIETLSKNPLTITIDGGPAGQNTHFAVVANRSISADISSFKTLKKEMEPDFVPYNGTFEQVTTQAMHPEGFAMSAYVYQKTNTVGITTVSLNLKRIVAKLEIKAQTTAAFQQKYGAATMTATHAMLQYLCKWSYIIEQSNMIPSVNSSNTINQTPSGNQNLFYIFERNKKGIDWASRLTLVFVYDADGISSTTNDRSDVYFDIDLDGAGEGAFRRNEAYLVNININGINATEVSATVSVADWSIGGNQNAEVGN